MQPVHHNVELNRGLVAEFSLVERKSWSARLMAEVVPNVTHPLRPQQNIRETVFICFISCHVYFRLLFPCEPAIDPVFVHANNMNRNRCHVQLSAWLVKSWGRSLLHVYTILFITGERRDKVMLSPRALVRNEYNNMKINFNLAYQFHFCTKIASLRHLHISMSRISCTSYCQKK